MGFSLTHSWENPWKRRKNFSFPHLFKPTFFVISPFWVFLQLFLPNMENLRFFYSFKPSQFVNLSFHLLALICASVLIVVIMAYFLFEGSYSGFLWIDITFKRYLYWFRSCLLENFYLTGTTELTAKHLSLVRKGRASKQSLEPWQHDTR